mgnify:CR=1 FL=1
MLKKQIDAGRIDGSTILRGPMTKQLWAVARNVPGVSHLVGFCHHCGASAKAGDAKCASCEAPFPSVGQQNVLGLAFATEAEAAAAEEQLAEQFNLTAPPTPIAPPMPTSVTGDTTSHAATGADVLSGLDRASLAVLATTRDTTASGSGHEGASPGRTPPVHGDGHASKRTLLLAGAIAAAIAIVVLIIALSGGKNDAPPQPQAKNPPVQPPVKETPPEPEAIVDTAIRMHDTVHTAWNRVETLDREGMIGVMIESAWDSMKRADTLLNEKAWDKALAVYDEAKVELDTIIEQSKLREDARQAKFEAESQMLLVTSTTLPVELMPDLEAIQFKFDEAVIHFQGGSFDKAKEAWQTVVASANTLLEKAKSPRGVDAD